MLALIPVATNTSHWKEYVWSKAVGICFLYETRLKFLENGDKIGKGAPMSCAMVYWGKNYKKFFDVFLKFGSVIDLRKLMGKTIGDAINFKKNKIRKGFILDQQKNQLDFRFIFFGWNK